MYLCENFYVNLLAKVVMQMTPRSNRPGAPQRGRYIRLMKFVFPILVLVAMLATLGVLALGVFNMAKGNNPQRSQKLMQTRVLLQGLALLLFAIAMLLFGR